MARHLYAYLNLPSSALPADVVPASIQNQSPSLAAFRYCKASIAFVLARSAPHARLRPRPRRLSHTDIIGVPPLPRLEGWEPRFLPGAWPGPIQDLLYDRGLDHISPAHFSMGCFPAASRFPNQAPGPGETPGVPELWMLAHQATLTDQEVDLATQGMWNLLQLPGFILWAANPDPQFLPRAFPPGVSPLERMGLFHELVVNPMGFVPRHLPSILDMSKATPERLLELPRLPKWTLRSTNMSGDSRLQALQVADHPQKG